MLLMVGLGNPGAQYERQRHTVGFMAVEEVAAVHGFSSWRTKHGGLLCEGLLAGRKVLLFKPQTFMNLSGRAVAPLLHFFKIPLADMVVLHDELDLAAGKVRIKTGGGVAGHNGLRSIGASLGSNDFKRLRIGIGHPGHKELVTGHVLGNFSQDDRRWLKPLLAAIAEAAPLLAAGDDAGCMNKIALLTRPPRPSKPPAGAAAGGGAAPED